LTKITYFKDYVKQISQPSFQSVRRSFEFIGLRISSSVAQSDETLLATATASLIALIKRSTFVDGFSGNEVPTALWCSLTRAAVFTAAATFALVTKGTISFWLSNFFSHKFTSSPNKPDGMNGTAP
jgi:hypothetical protein